MNVMRVAILGVAAIAAGAAAMLVRGMLGGGTTNSQASLPAPAVTMEVLVASQDIAPGHTLDAELVRWEAWPKSTSSAALITKDKEADIAKAVEGAVVRSPLIAGQPITDASIVRAGSAGFLAATIKSGMRAVAVPVSAETSAGGFVLPNDRVDVLLTRDLTTDGPKKFASETILRDVRVLAVDQIAHQEKDKDSVVAKTATLELTPDQAELLVRSQQSGVVSLALRALGDSGKDVDPPRRRVASGGNPVSTAVVVYRYGLLRGAGSSAASGQGAPANAGVAAQSEGIANPVTVTTVPAPSVGVPQ